MSPNSDAEPIHALLRWQKDRDHHFEQAAHCAGLGVWSWDLATNEVTWSELCRQLLGISSDAPASIESFFAAVHPEDRARVMEDYSQARLGADAHEDEYRILRPDGAIRWLGGSWRTVFDEDGAAAGALGVVRDVTERRLAEQARTRHATYLQHFVEATPAGIALLDRSLCYLATNRLYRWDAQLGAEDPTGRSLTEVLPGLPAHWRAAFERSLAGATERSVDEPWTRRDGSIVWVNRTSYPWYDEHKQIGGIVLIVDVLSHDRHLDAQGRLWAEAFLHSTRGIAITTAATNALRSVNATFAELIGYTAVQLEGRAILTLFPKTEQARISASEQLADAEGAASLETCQVHRDGTLIPVEVSIVSVRDGEGRASNRIITVTDLRQHLQVEGELRHRKAQLMAADRFRQLADSAPIGILLTDADSACTYANASWLQTSDFSFEQARDLGWWDAIHPDDRDRVADAWEGLSRGARFDLEFRYQRASGETRWVHARASEIRDDDGATLGFISAEVDITEQLQQRSAIDRFHTRVRSLAHRLEHLREQERRELAEMLQGGLRQDMTTLKLEIETLRNLVPADQRAAAALSRLLELADGCVRRLRHVAFELQPPGIEDLGFVNAVKRYADERTGQSGLKIRFSVTGLMPELGNRRLTILYRTFQEALNNTIRHAQAKQVEVSISVHERSLRLRVSDDGIGLREEDRNKSGAFGLFAASERLAQIGGALRVFGVAGQGTTLEVSVPLGRPRRKRDSAEL